MLMDGWIGPHKQYEIFCMIGLGLTYMDWWIERVLCSSRVRIYMTKLGLASADYESDVSKLGLSPTYKIGR